MITSVLFDVDPEDNPSGEDFEISLGPSREELNLIWFALREYEDNLNRSLSETTTHGYMSTMDPATREEDRAFLLTTLGQIARMKSELMYGLKDYLDDLN